MRKVSQTQQRCEDLRPFYFLFEDMRFAKLSFVLSREYEIGGQFQPTDRRILCGMEILCVSLKFSDVFHGVSGLIE